MALVTTKSEIGSANRLATDSRDGSGLVYDSLLSGVAFALILTVMQRVVGFVRGVLFCKLMTDQQLGQWSMVWSFLMLLAPLAMLGLPGCFGKYCEYYRHRGQLRSFIIRIGAISLSATGLVSVTIILFPELFSKLIFRDNSQIMLVRCLGFALFAVATLNYAVSLMESLRQIRIVTIMRFVTGIGFAVLGTGMLLLWNQDSSAVTLAYAICCIAGLLPAIWLLGRLQDVIGDSDKTLAHSAMWRRIAPFAVWLWVSNLMYNLFEVTDRYMLIHWSDTTAEAAQGLVGQYHSGRVIPLLLVSVAAMLGGLLLPYMSAAWEENRKDDAARQLNWTFKLLGLIFSIGGVLVLLASPILFDWILQGKYNAGLAVLPMTMVYCIWFSLHTVGQDFLWVAEKGKWATLAIAAGLVINVILNVLLIPSMGISGAVLATTCGNAVAISLILIMNHAWGCKTDVGIWLIAGTPLCLLLPWWGSCIILTTIGSLGYFTNWVFNAQEKVQIVDLFHNIQSKLRTKFS